MRKQKQTGNAESGRSMVEMLGVLVIMGVLAIGGIMAYRYAVTKYQANETFNELRRRMVVHSQQSMVGMPLSQVEMGDTTQLGYPIDVIPVEKEFFDLIIQDVDKDLCREIVRTGWTLPTQTRVNDVVVGTNAGACGEDNVLVFRFQTEMGGCKTDADCPCGTCENGTCRTSCAGGESCVKDFNDGQYVCCPSGKLVGNSCCEYPGENGTCCDENSGNCCPPDKPVVDLGGKCHSCEEERILNVGYHGQNRKVICNRCPSHIYLPNAWAYQHCVLPCPADKPLMDAEGVCYACDDSRGYIHMNNSLSVSSCSKCPGVWFLGGNKNIGNNEEVDGNNNPIDCWRCDVNVQSIFVGYYGPSWQKEYCLNCPNRIFLSGYSEESAYKQYCARICGENTSMDNVGRCHSCQESEDFSVSRVPAQYKCTCPGVRYLDGNICKKCPEDVSALTPEQQAQCGG